MKRFMQFIMERWIHIAGVIGVCVALWFAGDLLSIGSFAPFQSELSRWIAIASIVGAWIGIEMVLRSRAVQKDRELMTEVSKASGRAEQANIEEAQSEELAGLRKKFGDALELLKKTQPRGKRNRLYMYELPWYVIIGGPGTGKTTLLKNSGLKFPLADRIGRHTVKGVGGTRDCDWFFTDEAIFLDTAGRYTSQDSWQQVDKAVWKGFLELLKKHRPRRPINGVLVTMSMPEMLQQTEDERRKRSRELRQRIMELHEVLSNRFPIYMIFTKCDMVAGFNDFFADLGEKERVQVWGETFEGEGPRQLERNLAELERRFDTVGERMGRRVLERMQDERDIQRRGLILSFPHQMAALKPTLLLFLAEVFGSNRYEMEPLLRGVYFTSATQEGTPIDRMIGALAGACGMDRFEAPVFSGRGKSYFITRLLAEVMFPEADLAGVDPRLERRRRRMCWITYAVLAALLSGMTGLWWLSYKQNRQAIVEVEKRVGEYEMLTDPAGDADAATRAMLDRLNLLSQARGQYPDLSWKTGFGLYQGDTVRAGMDHAYIERLRMDLVPEIVRRLKMNMIDILQRGQASDSGTLYKMLKAYLILTLPDKADKEAQARAPIRECWKRIFPRDPNLAEELGGHSDFCLEKKLFTKNRIPEDKDLVRCVRQRLTEVPLETQIYSRIKSAGLDDASHDFRLKDKVPTAAKIFNAAGGKGTDALTIPGLFTAHGYDHSFKNKSRPLIKEALEEPWVLNIDRSGEMDRVEDEVRRQYFFEYGEEWQKLLAALKMKKHQGTSDIVKTLKILSKPEDTPLVPLLDAIEQNTALSADSSADGSNGKPRGESGENVPSYLRTGASSGGPSPELEEQFKDLNGLAQNKAKKDKMLKDLEKMHRHMKRLTDSSKPKESAQGGESKAVDDFKDFEEEFSSLPWPMKQWLQSITSYCLVLVNQQAKADLAALWRTEVFNRYKEGLQGRYPLFSNSQSDATVADFSNFFMPGGVIDQFFEKNIRQFVDTRGAVWSQSPENREQLPLSQAALLQFQYAAKIRDAFFPQGSKAPSVEFQLTPQSMDSSVSKFTISIDGQAHSYEHGPSYPSPFIKWPGPQANKGVELTFMPMSQLQSPVSQKATGPWAWLRILDKTTLARTNLPDRFTITFRVSSYSARYEIQAASVDNPFNLSELRQFRCPESLQ